MKTKINYLLILFLTLGILSCNKKDDPVKPAETTTLSTAVASAKTLLSQSKEGFGQGQYAQGSLDTLTAAIEKAEQTLSSGTTDQNLVDTAVSTLNSALDAFKGSTVETVALNNLVGHWTFDEGLGTTANDFSGNNFSGTLTEGHADYSTDGESPIVPEWTADRYGDSDKALNFVRGANVEVAYDAKLYPKDGFSFSAWISPANSGTCGTCEDTDLRKAAWFNDYIVSLNNYEGYEVRLYSYNPNKTGVGYPWGAVLAVRTDNDKGNWIQGVTETSGWGWFQYDAQDAPELIKQNSWHHIATTYDAAGTGYVYIDGVLRVSFYNKVLAENDNVTANAGSLKDLETPVNLVIGQGYPTSKMESGSESNRDPSWLGFFNGKIDEVRLYNKSLSAEEVKKIYDLEKN